jgi:transcriptional regulator of acetoin/glycerol metabolism
VLTGGDEVRSDDLPERIREIGMTVGMVTDAAQRRLPLRDLERAYILEMLRQAEGNKSRAAELLGLDRKTLYRKLEEYRAEELRERS